MPDSDSASPNAPQSLGDKIKEGLLQADTVARSASNIMTGGLADNADAAWAALFDKSPGDWLAHYKAALQDQQARDQYDASHRQVANTIGNLLGVGLLTYGAYGAGADTSAELPPVEKGVLGENLSEAKTMLQGDWPLASQVRKRLPNGRATVVDHVTAKGVNVEAKFGPNSDLSRNQTLAQQVWGLNYRVDRWMPYHVGALTAPAGTAGGLLSWGLQQQRLSTDATNDEDPWPVGP